MVVNITGGGNAREKQPCVREPGIGNSTQTRVVQKTMISYLAAGRISFASHNLEAMFGKQISGMFGKIRRKIFCTHLL